MNWKIQFRQIQGGGLEIGDSEFELIDSDGFMVRVKYADCVKWVSFLRNYRSGFSRLYVCF